MSGILRGTARGTVSATRPIWPAWPLASIVVCVLVGVAACNASPQERSAAACSTICRCLESPLPGAQDRCTSQCESQISVSEDCATCIAEHADRCAAIESDCQNVCNQGPVDDGSGDGFPDAGIKIVDAFVANKEGQR